MSSNALLWPSQGTKIDERFDKYKWLKQPSQGFDSGSGVAPVTVDVEAFDEGGGGDNGRVLYDEGIGGDNGFVIVDEGDVFLLNLVPNARYAYSTRLLRELFTGPSMRVRRSSDGALQDIGFDLDGNLDEIALLDFVTNSGTEPTNDGSVQIWYDQSGNGLDQTQGTVTRQPDIVIAGVIAKEGGRPVLVGNGTSELLVNAANYGTVTPLSVFAVAKTDVAGGSQRLCQVVQSASARFILQVGGVKYQWFVNAQSVDALDFGTLTFSQLTSFLDLKGTFPFSGSTVQIYQDGVLFDTDVVPDFATSVWNAPLSIFASVAPGNFYDGRIGELVIYDTFEFFKRNIVEFNQQKHWSTV